MKILFVLHDFLETNVAGTELHTYYLAKFLSEKHSVHLFYNLEDREDALGVSQGYYEDLPVTRVNFPAPMFNDYAPKPHRTSVIETFESVLTSFRPDIVHFQHLLHLSPELPRLVHKRDIPSVYTLHDFWLLCHQIKMLRKNRQLCQYHGPLKCALCHNENRDDSASNGLLSLEGGLRNTYWRVLEAIQSFRYFSQGRFQEHKTVFETIDLFISPSRFLRDIFIANGLAPNKITVVENGVPVINLWPRTPSPHLRFGYIGGLNAEKGLDVLLDAFSAITKAELRIYGVLNHEYARSLANSVQNPNIHFCGPVTGVEKEQALSDLDVMIVPSIWHENAPLAIQEAYMTGCPVIASDIGGMAEFVIDGKTGWHFKKGDSQDLRRKITDLIDNPELVEALRKNLPKVRTVEDNARDIESIYDELLGLKTHSSPDKP